MSLGLSQELKEVGCETRGIEVAREVECESHTCRRSCTSASNRLTFSASMMLSLALMISVNGIQLRSR
jgi:hypothetical protein